MVPFGGGYRYGARKAWRQEVLLGFMEDKGALFLSLVSGLLPDCTFANKVVFEGAP